MEHPEVPEATQSLLREGDGQAHDAAGAELRRWAETIGVHSMIAPAVFAGLRGAAAVRDIAEGDCLVSVPEALLVTAEAAANSDFGAALRTLPVDAQSRLLLWLMAERHDADSPHAPFWAALPQRFCSGLSFEEEALALLKGTPAHAECLKAIQHIRAAFQALAPMVAALLQAYPQHLEPRFFDWQAFLWATQFWYSYAMQVKLANGSSVEAVAPYACLLNHSAQPQVKTWQLVNGRLELRAGSDVAAGQQVFLSYGPHDNAHFLQFYGFVLPDNPNETVMLSFKVKPDSRAPRVHAALQRLSVPLVHRVGSGSSLDAAVTCLRVLHASETQLASISAAEDAPMDNDSAVWLHLRTTLTVLRARLHAASDRNAQLPAASGSEGRLIEQYISGQLHVIDRLLAAPANVP